MWFVKCQLCYIIQFSKKCQPQVGKWSKLGEKWSTQFLNAPLWNERPMSKQIRGQFLQIFFYLVTVLCISNFTVFGKLAVVFLSVKIQKILIYGLKEQKKCHKFKHQNLQNSQGYQNFRLDFTYDQFSNKEIQKTQLFDKIFETHRVLTNQLVPLEYKVSRKNIHL